MKKTRRTMTTNRINPRIIEAINCSTADNPVKITPPRIARTMTRIKNANKGLLNDFSPQLINKIKKKEWCESYFAQGAFYGIAYEELTKIPVSQVVIVIAVDNEHPQLFVEKRDDWVDKIWEAKKLYELNNIDTVDISR